MFQTPSEELDRHDVFEEVVLLAVGGWVNSEGIAVEIKKMRKCQ